MTNRRVAVRLRTKSLGEECTYVSDQGWFGCRVSFEAFPAAQQARAALSTEWTGVCSASFVTVKKDGQNDALRRPNETATTC